MLALLQDWVTLEGPASDSVTQSASKWLNLESYRDAIFFLEVAGMTTTNTELFMNYETAPLNEPTLFTAMVSEFQMATSSAPVITKVLLSQDPSCPVAGLVRWRIRQNAAAIRTGRLGPHCAGSRLNPRLNPQ